MSLIVSILAPAPSFGPALRMSHFGRVVGGGGWWKAPVTVAGENLEYRVDMVNSAPVALRNVRLVVDLPQKGVRYIPGTVVARTSEYPNGRPVPDADVDAPLFQMDELPPGEDVEVRFRLKVDPYTRAGTYEFDLGIAARALEMPTREGSMRTRVLEDDAIWGPERPIVVVDPAHTEDARGTRAVTFNSWLNYSTSFFDTTRFFYARPSGYEVTPEDRYEEVRSSNRVDDVHVLVGDVIRLETYVYNTADPSRPVRSTARGAMVRLDLPDEFEDELIATSYISADNSEPYQVFDTVRLWSTGGAFGLEYVDDSAWIYTDARSWRRLSDEVVDDGALIGHRRQDGVIPGTPPDDSAKVIVDVRIIEPTFDEGDRANAVEFTASVGPVGGPSSSVYETRPGSVVEWTLEAANVSPRLVKDLGIDAVLPDGVRIEPDSMSMVGAEHPDGYPLNDDGLFKNGVYPGDLRAGQSVSVRFRTVVADRFDYCGRMQIRMPAFANAPDVDQELDTAAIVVDNPC